MVTETGAASPDPQIRMANDIAAQFGYLPDDAAAVAVATHLNAFWTPRMRATLHAHVRDGGAGLSPIAAAAARRVTG